MRKIMNFAHKAVSCRNELNIRKVVTFTSRNKDKFIRRRESDVRDKTPTLQEQIGLELKRTNSQIIKRQRSYRRQEILEQKQQIEREEQSKKNKHEKEVIFNLGRYFETIQKKMEKQKSYCECEEHKKVNYKINALKRVVSQERIQCNEENKEKMKGLIQLRKLLKPSVKLDFHKLTEAIDKNYQQEMSLNQKEDDLRKTDNSLMSFQIIKSMKHSESNYSRQEKRQKSINETKTKISINLSQIIEQGQGRRLQLSKNFRSYATNKNSSPVQKDRKITTFNGYIDKLKSKHKDSNGGSGGGGQYFTTYGMGFSHRNAESFQSINPRNVLLSISKTQY